MTIVLNRKWNHFYARQQRGVLDTTDRLNILLETGRDAFRLENGMISRITEGQYTVKYSTVYEWLDLQFSVYDTYCDFTLEINDILATTHISSSPFAACGEHRLFKMESYIGIPIWVNGCLYGTLSFTKLTPRIEAFNERDKTFLRGMAKSAERILSSN